VAEKIVVEGKNVSEHEVEVCFCRHLGLPEPEETKKEYSKSFWINHKLQEFTKKPLLRHLPVKPLDFTKISLV
jgi:hypothetical protein